MIVSIFVLLIGCIGQDVRPGPNGIHSVAFLTDNQQNASRKALRQAKRYCKKTEKRGYAIHSEDFMYICEMDEQAYIRAKKAAAAAAMVGHATEFSAGENKTQEDIGTIISTGGAIADHTLGECYEIEMEFECK
jgi:hypothetical protein